MKGNGSDGYEAALLCSCPLAPGTPIADALVPIVEITNTQIRAWCLAMSSSSIALLSHT